MHTYQFASKYLPEEDRVLLRTGLGDKEAQIWLTRRLMKLLWPLLGKIAVDLATKQSPSQPAFKEIGEFQRQVALQEADFSTNYNTARESLWAEGPLLATQLVLKVLPNGDPVLCFRDKSGVGIEIPMDTSVHSGFCELMRKSVTDSGWDMALEYSQNEAATPAQKPH